VNLLKVVRWEFRRTAKSKSFLVMTVFIPAMIALAVFGVALGLGADKEAIAENPPPPFVLVVWLALLLFIGAFITAIMAFYSVIKEKANRVVELMLSSVSAMELMAGKILGLGLAGLIQVMAWSAAIGFAASRFVPITLSAFSIVHFVAYPLYFTLGYLLIAAMYATVGAAMKDVHSGGAQGMVGIIPYLPMMFVAAVIEHPEQVWIRIASFFPPFTPSLMMMRLAITPVPWWEVVASLVLLGVSVYALMRFAARVFEAAMLMYGKSATLREIWRWGIRSSCRQVPFRNRAP